MTCLPTPFVRARAWSDSTRLALGAGAGHHYADPRARGTPARAASTKLRGRRYDRDPIGLTADGYQNSIRQGERTEVVSQPERLQGNRHAMVAGASRRRRGATGGREATVRCRRGRPPDSLPHVVIVAADSAASRRPARCGGRPSARPSSTGRTTICSSRSLDQVADLRPFVRRDRRPHPPSAAAPEKRLCRDDGGRRRGSPRSASSGRPSPVWARGPYHYDYLILVPARPEATSGTTSGRSWRPIQRRSRTC